MKKQTRDIIYIFIVLAIIAILLMFVFNVFANPFLPVLDATDEDGFSVTICGVRYKQLPELMWDMYLYGNFTENEYTEVSTELLEKIAGKSLVGVLY